MKKGLLSMLLGALLVAVVILAVFYIIGIVDWLADIIVAGVIIAAIAIFGIVFAIAILMIFALFYYMAEKEPSISSGHYRLEDEKGKDE